MAFWGVEVKPGKRFTHEYDSTKGRLHISIATLGFGCETGKSTLLCKVGYRRPMCLCSIYPGNIESMQLNLEFEELEEVIFTVIGPRSIHLSGYYLGRGTSYNAFNINDDIEETYGEDIGDTDSERSSDSDEYDDSFIVDDDDVCDEHGGGFIDNAIVSKVFANCHLSAEEEGSHAKRMKGRKEYQSVQSDHNGGFKDKTTVDGNMDDTKRKEIDDDASPISSMHKKKISRKISLELENTVQDEMKMDKITPNLTKDEQNQKHGDNKEIGTNDKILPSFENGDEHGEHNGHSIEPENTRQDETKMEIITPDPIANEQNKENVNDKKTATISFEIGHEHGEAIGPSIKLDKIVQDVQKLEKIPLDLLTENEQNQENVDDKEVLHMDNILLFGNEKVEKPKKKRKERSNEGLVLIANGAHDSNLVHISQRNEHSKHPPVNEVMADNFSSHAAEKDSEKSRKKEKVNKGSHFEVDIGCHGYTVEEYKANMDKADSNNQEQHPRLTNEMSVDCGAHDFSDGNQNEGKVKKWKKTCKNKGNVEVNSELPLSVEQSSGMKKEDKIKRANANVSQVRRMSRGLVFEKMEMGKKDGIAASGKKISVHYTGKLKESSEVFESNVGKAPLYRIGMRVGEKRRLLMPPSVAYETKFMSKSEYAEKLPPNSLLVYDVEVVKVG